MSAIKEKIMHANLKKSLVTLSVIAVCFVILATIILLIMFSPQIREIRNAEEGIRNNAPLIVAPSKGDWYGYDMHPYLYGDFRITEPGTAVKISTGFITLSAAIIFFLIYLNIILWIYQAATKARMYPLLWVFLAIWGHIFTLILFGIVRSIIRKKCPSCLSYVKTKEAFCSECGHSFVVKCKNWGNYCNKEDKYCHNCGTELN